MELKLILRIFDTYKKVLFFKSNLSFNEAYCSSAIQRRFIRVYLFWIHLNRIMGISTSSTLQEQLNMIDFCTCIWVLLDEIYFSLLIAQNNLSFLLHLWLLMQMAGKADGFNQIGREVKTWLESGTLPLVNGMETLMIKVSLCIIR